MQLVNLDSDREYSSYVISMRAKGFMENIQREQKKIETGFKKLRKNCIDGQ